MELDTTMHAVRRALSPRAIVGLESLEAGSPNWQGKGVTFLQIEFDVFHDHADLVDRIQEFWPSPMTTANGRNFEAVKQVVHATAVSSIATSKKYGIAPEAIFRFAARSPEDNRAWDGVEDILQLILDGNLGTPLKAGDVISVSIQVRSTILGKPVNLPLDAIDDIRVRVNAITDRLGVLVFIAAGNGSVDLDRLSYDGRGKPADYSRVAARSRAIKVGYTSSDGKNTLQSNFGDAVQFTLPAESVRAACYDYKHETGEGDLLDSPTAGFARTSAATPMVAALAACIQGARLASGKEPFSHAQFLGFASEACERVAGASSIVPMATRLWPALEKLLAI